MRKASSIVFLTCMVFMVSLSECSYYNMIFHDDFDTTMMNTAKWSTVTQNVQSTQQQRYGYELQYYTFDNVFLNYNYMFLRTQRKPFGTTQPLPFTQFTNSYGNNNGQRYQTNGYYTNTNGQQYWQYTSGKVTTKGKFEFLYGTVEVRAKFPKGRGFLSTIQLTDTMKFAPTMSFMAPSTQDRQNKLICSYVVDAWRYDDFTGYNNMNNMNMNMNMNNNNNNYNNGGYNNYYNNFNNNNFTRDFTQMYVPDLTDDFHMYKIVWDPNFIVWYLDDREMMRISDPQRIPNRKMALEMNLSVGNREFNNEEPDFMTQFPNYMVIDYVSIQQFTSQFIQKK